MHGSLDDSSGLDSNLYDTISFNAIDRVEIPGRIKRMSINFSTAPVVREPEIWLFIIKRVTVAANPNSFQILRMHKLNSSEIKSNTGVQTFTSIDLPVQVGDYLAIRFSPGAGNPFTTERNQFYTYFDEKPYLTQKLLFSKCPTQGIAMSFDVQPSTSKF